MVELKLCPFCGGEGEAYRTINGTYSCSCTSCSYASCTGFKTLEEAIEVWNKRVPYCNDDFFMIRKPKKPLGVVQTKTLDECLTNEGTKITYKNSFIPDINSILDYVNNSINYEYERTMFKYIVEAYGLYVLDKDLNIEEYTCEMLREYDWQDEFEPYGIYCSKCNEFVLDWKSDQNKPVPNYCSSCGRKVINYD